MAFRLSTFWLLLLLAVSSCSGNKLTREKAREIIIEKHFGGNSGLIEDVWSFDKHHEGDAKLDKFKELEKDGFVKIQYNYTYPEKIRSSSNEEILGMTALEGDPITRERRLFNALLKLAKSLASKGRFTAKERNRINGYSVELTKKSEPFLRPEKKDASPSVSGGEPNTDEYSVLIHKYQFDEVTGILLAENGLSAEVEYRVREVDYSPFYKLFFKEEDGGYDSRVEMKLYDDGWRIP